MRTSTASRRSVTSTGMASSTSPCRIPQARFSCCSAPAASRPAISRLRYRILRTRLPRAHLLATRSTVTNHGPTTISGATLTVSVDGAGGPRDAAPAHFTSATGAQTCVVAAQSVTCQLPTLAAAETTRRTGQWRDGRRRDVDACRDRHFEPLRPDAGQQRGARDDHRHIDRPQHRGHEHERHRPRLAASGDRRVERGQRRPRHDRLQHPGHWRADDRAALGHDGHHGSPWSSTEPRSRASERLPSSS